MTDCPNAAVRDLLPDVLHDRLDEATRAMVEAHVDDCAECREELALLRGMAGVLRYAPRLDLTAISAAIPAYRAPMKRSWVGWRTAAAITLMVVGGSSVAVLRRNVSPIPDSVALPPSIVASESAAVRGDSTVAAPSPVTTGTPATVASPAVVQAPTPQVAEVTAPARAGRELALSGGSINELSDRQLAMLLKEIESMDAVPTTDVENNAIAPIAPRRSTP